MRRIQERPSEEQIRERFEQGDRESATSLVLEAYGPGILAYLLRTMRDETDASEVFSQFCEDLWRGIGSFQGRSKFSTWAYRLATHARARFWLDPYRRRARPLEPDELSFSRLRDRVRTTTLAYLRTDVKDGFARIREHLDPEEQSLLSLRSDREMSWTEIAEVLAAPDESLSERELESRAATLRQRFKRLKDKIRKIAQEQGLLGES